MDGIKLFVYGTLMQGFSNHDRLVDPTTEFLGLETIEGKMYGGWGPPIIDVLDTGTIHGELYSISPQTLQRVDQLEGYYPGHHKQYGYTRVIVKTHSGIETYVYSMTTREHHDYKAGKSMYGTRDQLIEDGDYRKNIERRQKEIKSSRDHWSRYYPEY